MSSIRTRLSAVLAGLTLLLCGVIAVAFLATAAIERTMHSVLTDRVIPLRDLKAISDAYAVDIVDTMHKVRGGSFTFERGIASVEKSKSMIVDRWASYRATALTNEERELVAEAESQRRITDAGVEKLLATLRSYDLNAVAVFNDERLYPIIEPMTAAIDKLVVHQINETEGQARDASAAAMRNQRLMWLGLMLGALFVAYALHVVFLDILKPLSRLTRSVAAIGAGNLDKPVPDQARKDEVGSMAVVVERLRIGSREMRGMEAERASAADRDIAQRDALLVSIRALAAQVGGNVAVLNRSADAIRGTSFVLTESANETAQRSNSAESSLNSNTEAIQSMAAATSQLSSAIEEVSAQGARIVESVDSMASRAGAAGARIDELNTIAEKASAAVDLIATVADQTNLLALNATIEAARAGEAGRGFAVVASEVKALAAQAAQATSDIRDLIQTMNNTALSLQEAMAEVQGGVGDLKAVALFVKEAVQEQSISTAAISRSIEETAQASSLILADVQVMNRSARETGDAAEGVASVAGDLIEASARLEADMEAFAARMQAA